MTISKKRAVDLACYLDCCVANALAAARELNADLRGVAFEVDIALLDLIQRPNKKRWLEARAVADKWHGVQS